MKNVALPLIFLSVSCLSPAALVAHWNFEEGSGTATDNSSNTATDAFGAGVAWSTDTPGAASSYSLSFPGTSTGNIRTNLDAATVGINGTGAKTITSWIKSGDTAGVDRMFFGWTPSNGGTGGADLRLGLDRNGFLRFEVTGGFAVYETIALDDDAWHMVGVVIDSSDNVNAVQFYVDGNLVNPTSAGNRLIDTQGTSGDALRDDISFGIGNPGGSQQWSGLLDDMRIYNTALDDPSLDGIYNAIPEPAASLLGFLGFLGLLAQRRRC